MYIFLRGYYGWDLRASLGLEPFLSNCIVYHTEKSNNYCQQTLVEEEGQKCLHVTAQRMFYIRSICKFGSIQLCSINSINIFSEVIPLF